MVIRNRGFVSATALCGACVVALTHGGLALAQSAKDVKVVNVPMHGPSLNVTVTNEPTVHVAPGAAVAITGTPTVQVGNTSVNPVVTRDADRRAEEPVMLSGTFNLASGTGAQTGSLVLSSPTFTVITAVPPGQRLTAKFLSVEFTVPTGQMVSVALISKLGNASMGQAISLSPPQTIGLQDTYRTSQPVLVFVDPNSTVDVFVTRFPSTGAATANVEMTGHLVDVP
jgi:hypothetical protein